MEEPRVGDQRACLAHAGGYGGKGSAVARMCFEWEEPGWPGVGHGSRLCSLLGVDRARRPILLCGVSRVSDRCQGKAH